MNDITNIVRVGQVSSVNPRNGSVRVAFDDMLDPSGNPLVSGELQMLMPCTGKSKDFYLPNVGEHVRCVFLSNGIQEGFVDGSFYTAENLPEDGKEGIYRKTFDDGAVLEYDLDAHIATVKAETIKITGNIEIIGDVTVTGSIKADGDIIDGGNNTNHHTH